MEVEAFLESRLAERLPREEDRVLGVTYARFQLVRTSSVGDAPAADMLIVLEDVPPKDARTVLVTVLLGNQASVFVDDRDGEEPFVCIDAP